MYDNDGNMFILVGSSLSNLWRGLLDINIPFTVLGLCLSESFKEGKNGTGPPIGVMRVRPSSQGGEHEDAGVGVVNEVP